MRHGEAQRYIKVEDHEKALNDQYNESRKEVERMRDRVKEAEKRGETRGYERGMADAWKDALSLLRRLSAKDAANKAVALMAKAKR